MRGRARGVCEVDGRRRARGGGHVAGWHRGHALHHRRVRPPQQHVLHHIIFSEPIRVPFSDNAERCS